MNIYIYFYSLLIFSLMKSYTVGLAASVLIKPTITLHMNLVTIIYGVYCYVL